MDTVRDIRSIAVSAGVDDGDSDCVGATVEEAIAEDVGVAAGVGTSAVGAANGRAA